MRTYPLKEVSGWVDIRNGLVLIESEGASELLELPGKVISTL